MTDLYRPKPGHKFSFGLWTLGNRGRDPFGDAVRATFPPTEIVATLGEVGAWGVNLHDNDLVPIEATAAERDKIVRDFKKACADSGIVVPMATVNLFYHPIFRDGAFTSNDPEVRAYGVQKTMRAMDLGAELGAKIFVLWGGREGVETDACRRPDEAVKRLREAVNYLCEIQSRSRLRIQVCARGQAQRTSRGYLHVHDRPLPGFHSDSRSSGNGGR